MSSLYARIDPSNGGSVGSPKFRYKLAWLRRLRRTLAPYGGAALDLIYPPLCLGCGARVAEDDDPLDVHAPGMRWQYEHLLGSADRLRYRPTRDNWGPLEVPQGRYFVLGDNRDDSEDSRYWGFVDATAVKGQPLFVYYSFDPRTFRSVPWLTEIRWDRIGGAID